jgi:glutathione S-transferase
MITFYWAPRSSATRIHWALGELGIPHENVKLDLGSGDTRKAEFLALNPNGKVPLLVDEGMPIFESGAILIHLGISYGQDKGLWPAAGAKLHGQALSWVLWSAATLSPVMFRYLTSSQERFPRDARSASSDPRGSGGGAPGDEEARNPKQAEDAKTEIEKLFGILEKRLEQSPYVVGGTFTFADLAVTSSMNVWQMAKKDFPPAIKKWRQACQDRPAFQATMAAQT